MLLVHLGAHAHPRMRISYAFHCDDFVSEVRNFRERTNVHEIHTAIIRFRCSRIRCYYHNLTYATLKIIVARPTLNDIFYIMDHLFSYGELVKFNVCNIILVRINLISIG